jgi:HEAT repeat protein
MAMRILIGAASLLLFSCAPAGAGQVPSLGFDAIPPDMPAEVRELVLQLYSDSVRQIVAAEGELGGLGPAAVAAAPYLASMLSGHFSVAEANGAAQALVKIGKGAFDAVAVAAHSLSGETRWRAVLVLAAIDSARAPPVILDIFVAGRGRDQERAALRQCGQPGLDHVVEALGSREAAKRRAAAIALPAFSSISLRCRGLDGHSGTGGRPTSAGNTQMVVDLLLRAVGDPEAEVRLAVLQSLARVTASRDNKTPRTDAKLPLTDALLAALKDPNAAIRREAVGIASLADGDAKTKSEALQGLAADPDPDVRGAAASALGGPAGEAGRPVGVLAKLLKDPSPEIRERAALALGASGAPEAEALLLEALKDESRPVCLAALKALAAVSGRAGVEALIPLVQRHTDPAVRVEALQTLALVYQGCCAQPRKGHVKTVKGLAPEDAALTDAIFPVLAQAMADPLADLHLPAIQALGRTPRDSGRDIVPLLILALKSPGDGVAHAAHHVIMDGGFYDQRLLPVLHEAVLRGRRRGHEFELLGKFADPRSVPVLEKVAEQGGLTGSQAIGTLLGIGPAAREAGLKLLGHAQPAVREAASQAIAQRIQLPGMAEFVRAAFAGSDEKLRDGARRVAALVPPAARTFAPPEARLRASVLEGAEALRMQTERMGKTQIAQAALPLLEDAEPAVRAVAAQIMGQLQERLALPVLKKLVADPSVSVRAQAIEALGRLGDRQGVPAILTALRDPEAGVREAAALALGQLGDGAAVEPLLEVLADPDWCLRRAAAQSLGGLADARAAEALQRLAAQDPHWCVRRAAVSAMGRRADKSLVPALIPALEDEHWSVRSSAHESLVTVTRQKLDPAPEAWRTWWESQRNPVALPERKD